LDNVVEHIGDNYGNLNEQENQFYLALVGMSNILAGCSLVRVSCFDAVFPERKIHPCKEGQNFQILLPLLYRFPRLYLHEPLVYYVTRKDSHYHRERTPAEWLARSERLLEMLRDIFKKMNLPEAEIGRLARLSCFNKARS
jgi:hypothetical protein